MLHRSNLLEHVARRIIDRILSSYTSVLSVQVNVQKLNPPLGGKIKSVGITITENRIANNIIRSKSCSRCGTFFECTGDTNCWCHHFQIEKNRLAEINEKYPDCLCPSCLSQYAEK